MSGTSFRMSGLVKSYRDFTLGPLDLEVEPGSVIALVGPNGSGKTTTMHCLLGLVLPDGGEIEIAGRSNRSGDVSWKQEVGFVGEVQGYYKRWTVRENFDFLRRFYPRWDDRRVADLSRRFGLQLGKKVNELSKGNRRKMALVAALAYEPKVLLFDEPTSGLDPVVRAEVLDVLWEILEEGDASILYSTHVLSDISRLAYELVFLRDGKILGRHDKEDLLASWRRVTFRHGGDLPKMPEVFSSRVAGRDHQIVTSDFETTAQALGDLGAENVHANRMTVEEISVEVLRQEHVVEAGRAATG